MSDAENKAAAMGGEGDGLCLQCGVWTNPFYTCDRCRTRTCIDCSERLEKREQAMTKRLDLDWSKVELCCMCLDILYIKALEKNKTKSS